MADWSDQITKFQRSCMQQQQQMLSGWFGTLQKAGTGTPQNVWREALDTLEQQINGTLDTQQQSFRALLFTLKNSGNSTPEISQWQTQAETGMSAWIEVQHQLWNTWFNMLRSASPAQKQPGEIITQNWQDMMQQAVEMQQQWLSTWAGGQSDSKKSKPSKKPST